MITMPEPPEPLPPAPSELPPPPFAVSGGPKNDEVPVIPIVFVLVRAAPPAPT
jgi:hypothetical protein